MDAAIKDDITQVIKSVLGTFTIQYTKAYTLAIVHMIKLEANKPPNPYELEERPPRTDSFKSGYLVKEGAIRKNWKKRWFVVRPSYQVDYYESEEVSMKPKGKKKGTMQLAGYSVVEDPNQGTLVRLKRLAEKMGMDFSNLPKPKEYPPLCFEVYHSRRRPYYIQCKDQEEFNDWVAQFRTICWRSWGLTIDEYCHKRAFPIAVRKTRWEMGRWGWYWNYGSEEQILCEMISDELEYDIMGRLYSKFAGPWMVRNTLRNQAQKVLDSMIIAAVKPGWAAMAKAVEELRPKIEPKIREAVTPIFEAQVKIENKMKDAVMGILNPILEKNVVPHLSKIVDIIQSPVRGAFDTAIEKWEAKLGKYEPAEDLPKSFRDLDYFARSYWELRDATVKINEMYEPLWALHIIFKDISPWHLIWKGQDMIYDKMDDAVYTFEKALLAVKENQAVTAQDKERIQKEVHAKLIHDTNVARVRYFAHILKEIVILPFEEVLHPATKHVIEPIAELVPEPLREFIDVKEDFENFYNKVLDSCIETILKNGGDYHSPMSPKETAIAAPASPKVEHEKSSDSAKAQNTTADAFSAIADSLGPEEKFVALDSGRFFLVSEVDESVLDIEGGSDSDNAQLITYAFHGGKNQQFRLDATGHIISHANKVLDVLLPEGATGPQPGNSVVHRTENGGATQQWRLHHDGTIRLDHIDLCLHIESGSVSESGSRVVAWPVNGGTSQKWRVVNIWN